MEQRGVVGSNQMNSFVEKGSIYSLDFTNIFKSINRFLNRSDLYMTTIHCLSYVKKKK